MSYIFTCTCYITGVNTRVTGKWELKLEKGKERITFYRLFDEDGNDSGNSLPVSMRDNGRVYIEIDVDKDRDTSFRRITDEKEKLRKKQFQCPQCPRCPPKPLPQLNFLDEK